LLVVVVVGIAEEPLDLLVVAVPVVITIQQQAYLHLLVTP
jgi:hypothetical protein